MLSNASGVVRGTSIYMVFERNGGEKAPESLKILAIALFWGQGGGRVAPGSLKRNWIQWIRIVLEGGCDAVGDGLSSKVLRNMQKNCELAEGRNQPKTPRGLPHNPPHNPPAGDSLDTS